MKKKITLSLATVLLCAGAARAQFFGMPVFDATNYANAILGFEELQRQLAQMVGTYQQIVLQYRHMVWLARTLPFLRRYRFASTPWLSSRSADTYGTTGGWTRAINSGLAVEAGYRRAVESLMAYGAALGRIPADQAARARTRYATVELADAANLHGIEVIGLERDKAGLAERQIRDLEDATLSEDPELNTEVGALNKINAAAIMALRSSQETNQLLVALLEHGIASSKARRDAEAAAINADIVFRLNAHDAAIACVRGTADAVTSFRMP